MKKNRTQARVAPVQAQSHSHHPHDAGLINYLALMHAISHPELAKAAGH